MKVRVTFSKRERELWCALFGHRWSGTEWTLSTKIGDVPRAQCAICRRTGGTAPSGHVLMSRNLRESIDGTWPRSVPILLRWRWTAVHAEDLPDYATECAACGRDPAVGFAFVDGDRYCHPDEGPSCYDELRPSKAAASPGRAPF